MFCQICEGMNIALEKLIGQLLLEFEKYLELKKLEHLPSLYDPVNYIMSGGGKRLRPLLALLGYIGYDDDYQQAMSAAYAIELFHNFTLVHDDIMDESPIRRKRPTVHKAFDVNSAILSGDVMQLLVFKELSSANSENTLLIVERFCEIAIQVCEGQSLDMVFESESNVSVLEYFKMIEFKTAVLLGLSLEIGALLAGASKKQAHHLYEFGKYAGIAFQLQDDFLDLYGDTDKTGKQRGGDIIQRKKSFFYVKAIDLLEGEEKIHFLELYRGDSEERVSRVMEVFDELYLKNYLDECKKSYLELANSHLQISGYNTSKLNVLEHFTHQLTDRSR